ncbi:hypothetical protein Aperf_G00000044008 [Anoplocephala perfoliata]
MAESDDAIPQFEEMLNAVKRNSRITRREYYELYNKFEEVIRKIIENRKGIDQMYRTADTFFRQYLEEIKMPINPRDDKAFVDHFNTTHQKYFSVANKLNGLLLALNRYAEYSNYEWVGGEYSTAIQLALFSWDNSWISSYERLIGLLFNEIHSRRGYIKFDYKEAHKCVQRFLNVIHDDLPSEYTFQNVKMRNHISSISQSFSSSKYKSFQDVYIHKMLSFYDNVANHQRVFEALSFDKDACALCLPKKSVEIIRPMLKDFIKNTSLSGYFGNYVDNKKFDVLRTLREVVFYFVGEYNTFDEWMRNYAIRREEIAIDAIANGVDLDPRIVPHTVSEVKSSLQQSFTEFIDPTLAREVIAESTKYFLEKNATVGGVVAELSSKCLDRLFIKRNESVFSEDEFKGALLDMAGFYRVEKSEGLFQEIYSRSLSARFLQNQFFSLQADELAFKSLKEVLKQEFLHKIDRMFEDIRDSHRCTRHRFTELHRALDCNVVANKLFCKIVAKSIWPVEEEPEIRLPPEITAFNDRFAEIYNNDRNDEAKKNVAWSPNLSFGEIEMNYVRTPCTLAVNAYQATILMLFNNNSGSLTVGEIITATGIGENMVKRNLKVMIGVGLLTIDSPREGVELNLTRESRIILNENFQW